VSDSWQCGDVAGSNLRAGWAVTTAGLSRATGGRPLRYSGRPAALFVSTGGSRSWIDRQIRKETCSHLLDTAARGAVAGGRRRGNAEAEQDVRHLAAGWPESLLRPVLTDEARPITSVGGRAPHGRTPPPPSTRSDWRLTSTFFAFQRRHAPTHRSSGPVATIPFGLANPSAERFHGAAVTAWRKRVFRSVTDRNRADTATAVPVPLASTRLASPI
jgi:hypothetical protein